MEELSINKKTYSLYELNETIKSLTNRAFPDTCRVAAGIAELKRLLEASEMSRRQASSLLDRAKRAVEIAIEQSEAAAMEYLNRTVHNSGGSE